VTLRILPIDAALADQVRRELKSPQYGHPATVERAKGYGPCRQCLRTFRTGEEDRILFTYNPMRPADGLPDPGPVFIHKEPCAGFDGPALPEDLRALPLFLEGYGEASWLVRRVRVEHGDVEAAAAQLFADPAIDSVQLRNAEAGCFIARVERDQPAAGISSIDK
jgi:hypothetical protein